MRRMICAFCMGLCLTIGCISEHRTGISRVKQLHQIPDTGCIIAVLRGVPEIQGIDVLSEGRVKTGDRPRMDQVFYEGDGYYVELVVRVNERGEIRFGQNHTMFSVRKRMSHDEIERTRAVMKAVEVKLVSQCGMKELISGAEETVYK